MDNVADRSTRDVTNSRLKLADELIFTPQVHGDRTVYHIEAASRGTFYRVGYPEYVFMSLLDGETTVAQVLTMTARRLGTQALTQTRGLRIANWLLESGLAEFAEKDVPPLASKAASGDKNAHLLQRLNPFWMKIPLGSPDRIMTALAPLAGWLFSAWGMVAGLALIVFGAGCLAVHWDAFATNAAAVVAPDNWLWMGLAWLVLKVIHELAHGVACKFYRGEVRETGVIFILFAPLAYVDVTSCWRFPSKWQRIHVAAAGMYVELLLAAIAAIALVNTDSAVAQHLLRNVMVMASLSTLLFNINPLMRFDGYYIFSDLIGIPNLATEGSRFRKQLAARIFYGTRMPPLQMIGFRRWCVRCHGLASAAWSVLICCTLATAASALLNGAGLLLAFAALAMWIGRPLWWISADLLRRFHEARASFVRAVAVGSALAAVLIVVLTQVTWPGAMTAPAIVEFADLALVRSRTSGFVERVHVHDGQTVVAGQLLVELRNDELQAARRELELAWEQGRVRQRIALDRQDAAGIQIAARNLQAIAERLDGVRRRTDALRVLAPVGGRVVSHNLHQIVGVYVQEGGDLLAIGDERRKELVVSVGQEEIDALLPLVGKPAKVRVGGRTLRRGTLQGLEPRASAELPHPAMSSRVGGPLAVTEGGNSQQPRLLLTEPRFRGVVSLAPGASRDLGAGEQGYALIGPRDESIGEVVWVGLTRWLESLTSPAH